MLTQSSAANSLIESLKISQDTVQDTLVAVQKGLRKADHTMRATLKERPYHVTAGVLACGFLLGALIPMLARRRA